MEFEVGKVDKMVSSVSKLNYRGFDVVFQKSTDSEYGGQPSLETDGTKISLVRCNGVIYMKAQFQAKVSLGSY